MAQAFTDAAKAPKPLPPAPKLIGATILYCLWWSSLCDIIQFAPTIGVFHALSLPWSSLEFIGADLSLLLGLIGVIVGCLVLFAAHRRNQGALLARQTQRTLLIVEGILSTLLCLAVFIFGDAPVPTALLYGSICACAVGNVATIASNLEPFDNRQIAAIALCCLGAWGLLFTPLFPMLCSYAAPLATILSLAFLIAAALLLRSSSVEVDTAERTPWIAELNRMPPLLLFTLFAYGFVFGAADALRQSAIPDASLVITLATAGGALIAAIALALLFYGRPASVELWSRLRGSVFPITLVGIALIPASFEGALLVTSGAELLFYAFLATICVDIMQLTGMGATPIVAHMLFWSSLGKLGGALSALATGSPSALAPSQFSLLAVASIVVLSVATLWIGSDEEIRKNWGLRPKLAPKQFNDAAIRYRCEALAASSKLTPRETETIIALAQGSRPAEIQEAQGVTIHTVRAHIQHAYGKLGIHSAAELQALLKTIPLDEGQLACEPNNPS